MAAKFKTKSPMPLMLVSLAFSWHLLLFNSKLMLTDNSLFSYVREINRIAYALEIVPKNSRPKPEFERGLCQKTRAFLELNPLVNVVWESHHCMFYTLLAYCVVHLVMVHEIEIESIY